MPDRLIAKILDDIGEIHPRPPFKVNLSRVNEPFLDTRFWDIAREIENRFPEAQHMLFLERDAIESRKPAALS